MDLQVVPLHKHPEYLKECCELINDEWNRSDTARLRSLETSSDSLPVNLILLDNKIIVGHLKLSVIPSLKDACFVETVVIDKNLRGKGYGSHLMLKAEEYCKDYLKLNTIFLSTHGQELFYSKLGYSECTPVSIYGNYNSVINSTTKNKVNTITLQTNLAPPPPPMPLENIKIDKKIFMNKLI